MAMGRSGNKGRFHAWRQFGKAKQAASEFRRYRKEKEELHKEFHRKVNELYINDRDLKQLRRRARFGRPVIIVFNLLLWFVLFKYFGLRGISTFFAILISLGGILEIFFLIKLEKRVFKPIESLQRGVMEISEGNYEVEVEGSINNEIGFLVTSFNKMARKLQEGERLKAEYEENRKNLIANISHDLKTPITSIQGYVETMMDAEDIPKENLEKYYKIIYNNAAYINKLIDDLFLFSKLDMQKLEFHFDKIDIKAFMADIMEEFSFELDDRKVGFEYEDMLESSSLVNIDRKRVDQIFKNIIGNAIKYGSEGETMIKVKLYGDNGHIYIDIKDNGPGIPQDKLPFIFDRFYRVDYARTKDLMSTGLGLSISKELVEAHNGSITVESIEKLGTCFTICLPVEEE